MLLREWEQHKTSKWVRSSAYAYVAGVLTCLCLCYACAYALVRTSLYFASLLETCDANENPRASNRARRSKKYAIVWKGNAKTSRILVLQSLTNYTRALLRTWSSRFCHRFFFPFLLTPVIVGLKRGHITSTNISAHSTLIVVVGEYGRDHAGGGALAPSLFWLFLLEWMIWWDTSWHINRCQQINDTLFRQRITAWSTTDL